MKKLIGILCFTLLTTHVFANEGAVADSLKQDSTSSAMPEFTPRSPTGSRLPVIVPFGEVTFLNLFVWGWDRYVLQKDYAKTGPSYWERNFKEGWKWDDNHFAINFFGHP